MCVILKIVKKGRKFFKKTMGFPLTLEGGQVGDLEW